jgi:large subunit ribosomal protein L4
LFSTPLRPDIIHRVVVWQDKNARKTLYKAKTRAEVRGGGRKPWKQKGTGRARHGSIRSPIWKGGGVAHGAVFRDWSISLNKKVRLLGLRVAIASKARDRRLVVVDSLDLGSPKTGTLSKALSVPSLGLPPPGRKRLVFVDADSALPKNFLLAVRNLP